MDFLIMCYADGNIHSSEYIDCVFTTQLTLCVYFSVVQCVFFALFSSLNALLAVSNFPTHRNIFHIDYKYGEID